MVQAERKIVLLIQSSRFQGQLWHDALSSQGIVVSWESSPDFDLIQYFSHLQESQQPLPDAICLEVGEQSVMTPYGLCRWCSDRYRQIKLILINSDQSEISALEEKWAHFQGAAVLFSKPTLENLVPSIMSQINIVLTELDEPALRGNELLVTLAESLRSLKNQSLLTEEALLKTIPIVPHSEQQTLKVTRFWSKLTALLRVG
jgi:hypothetical protein